MQQAQIGSGCLSVRFLLLPSNLYSSTLLFLLMIRVGQLDQILAGKSPNIWSFTVYVYTVLANPFHDKPAHGLDGGWV
jgi:hypothetical protein